MKTMTFTLTEDRLRILRAVAKQERTGRAPSWRENDRQKKEALVKAGYLEKSKILAGARRSRVVYRLTPAGHRALLWS